MKLLAILFLAATSLHAQSYAHLYRCFDGWTAMTAQEVWNDDAKYFDLECEKGFELVHVRDLHRCVKGKIFGGGMGTSDYMWEPGCYTPKKYHAAQVGFWRSMCGCCGLAMFSGEWSSSTDSAKWDSANEKCVQIPDEYQHRVDGKWVDVTKEEYYRGTCARVSEGIGTKEVAIYPKPEWTECKQSN